MYAANIRGVKNMNSDILKILFDENTIKNRVRELAKKISADCAGKETVLLVILKGSLIFASDLMREMTTEATLDFMQVSSYGGGTVSGELKIIKDAQENLYGKNVIIVEDIIDTGKTLSALGALLSQRGAGVKICAFLSKPSRREADIEPDYLGFEIPDEFVVGYGMDYDEKYRGLPYVGILKKEVYGG